MQAFKTYLKTKHYSPRTISDDCSNVTRFLKWYDQPTEEQQSLLTVIELVEYINTLQTQNISAQVINQRLRSIHKYYEYLKSEGHLVTDFERVSVKGTLKKVIVDPLDYSDLEQLYTAYPIYRKERQTELGKTLKNYNQATLVRHVITGLLVFQGLRSYELKAVERHHINEENGTIYIPASRKSSARELKLFSAQMRPLFKYLDYLEEKQASLRLFTSDMDNQLFQLLQELKGLNYKVQTATHIRASVILHWLQLHGKRQTQYMIGHKWVSSTEYYQLQNLQELTNLLDEHNPFKVGY